MNRRIIITSILGVVCLATLWSTATQRQQVLALRAQRQRLLDQTDNAFQASGASTTTAGPAESSGSPGHNAAVPAELLRLRGEVARLTQRRQELEGVQRENQTLRARLADSQTNNASAMKLPPGYIRRAQARQVGYGTPEDTMQTFLWALHNHDFTNLLQAFTPPAAQHLASAAQRADGGDFFRDADAFIGFSISGRTDQPDGSVLLTIEVLPGTAGQRICLVRVNGQWKMASPL
jgi:hypothetical protein